MARAATILEDGLSRYVPSILEGSRHELVGFGTQQEANEAAVGHTPCIIRPGVDGVWRTWQLRRPNGDQREARP